MSAGTASAARHSIFLSSGALFKSSLNPLADILNKVFEHGHIGIPGKELLPPNTGRLSKPSDFIDELGPDVFCIIMFESEEGGRIVATGGAKPYTPTRAASGKDSHARLLFKRPPPTAEAIGADVDLERENTSKWE